MEKRVDLDYGTFVNATGGSGEVIIAQPVMKESAVALPSGGRIVGKSGNADVVIGESPANWLLSALVRELTAAGFTVKTVATLPSGVSKGVRAAMVSLSANQSSGVVTITTIAEVKLEVELWRDGRPLKTLTASARDQEEGMDRSSEPIRWTLEKTLQRAMQELIPTMVEALR